VVVLVAATSDIKLYTLPSPSHPAHPPRATRRAAQQLLDAGIQAPRVMPDNHVGAGGALATAQADFAGDATFLQSAVNAETNAGTHDMGRALGEAADLIEWQNADAALAARMLFRTASFCSERSGHFGASPPPPTASCRWEVVAGK
jgi:hypothetical protein